MKFNMLTGFPIVGLLKSRKLSRDLNLVSPIVRRMCNSRPALQDQKDGADAKNKEKEKEDGLLALKKTKTRTSEKWILPDPNVLPPGSSEVQENMSKLQKLPLNWRKDKTLPMWKRQAYAMQEKLKGAKWEPRKKVSPEGRMALRMFKQEYPEIKSSELAKFFGISPESMRRILRSKFQPQSTEELDAIGQRWAKRKEKILDHWESIGRIKRKDKDGTKQ
ncbi:hypothetical protein V1511DRAFT_105347 [Dipodascopsis uninucleata]